MSDIDMTGYVGHAVYGHRFVNGRNRTELMGMITHVFDGDLLVSAYEPDTDRSHALRVAPLWRDHPVGESPLIGTTDINGEGVEIEFDLDGWSVEISQDELTAILKRWGWDRLI